MKDKVKERLGFSFSMRINITLRGEDLTRLIISIRVLAKISARIRVSFR